VPDDGLVISWSPGDAIDAAPVLPDLRAGGGFTISVTLSATPDAVHRPATIVSAYSNVTAALGEEPTDRRITKGYELSVRRDGEVELVVTDGFDVSFRHATSTAAGRIWDRRPHTISFTLDGGPKVATTVVDEQLDDGGDGLQGWAFHPVGLGEVGGSELTVDPEFGGTLHRLLVFDRPLLTSEAIAIGRSLSAPA
jgi:hypothetical protein